MKEVTIGLLSDMHPDVILKTDLREDLNLLLKSVPLKRDELTKLMKNAPVDEEEIEKDNNKIFILAYDIVNNKFGYGNAKDRVSTRAIGFRCDLNNAHILKNYSPESHLVVITQFLSCQKGCYNDIDWKS